MRSSWPCSRRNSERWKPSGNGWRIVSAITRGPAKPMSAHGRAHAAAEIRELEGGHHDRKAAHPADAGDDGLRRAGLLARRPHTVAVPLRVLEAERIGRHDAAVALLERAVVDELGDALMRGDPERVATLRTHATRPLHLGAVHDRLAGL